MVSGQDPGPQDLEGAEAEEMGRWQRGRHPAGHPHSEHQMCVRPPRGGGGIGGRGEGVHGSQWLASEWNAGLEQTRGALRAGLGLGQDQGVRAALEG